MEYGLFALVLAVFIGKYVPSGPAAEEVS